MWPRGPARYHAHQEHHREIDDGRPHRDLPDRQRGRENLVHRDPAGTGGPPPGGPSPSGASRALDLVAEGALHFALEVLRLALAFLSAPFGTRRRIARLLLRFTGHLVRDALGLVLEFAHGLSPISAARPTSLIEATASPELRFRRFNPATPAARRAPSSARSRPRSSRRRGPASRRARRSRHRR